MEQQNACGQACQAAEGIERGSSARARAVVQEHERVLSKLLIIRGNLVQIIPGNLVPSIDRGMAPQGQAVANTNHGRSWSARGRWAL
jgi:hypothetical protein